MMDTASRAYLDTRVSILATRLFDHRFVERLARMELGELAERFGLTAVLDAPLPVRAKSRALEQALLQTLMADLAILLRPLSAIERALLLHWARQYALSNLKTLVRGKLYALDWKEIRENLYDLPPRVRLPRQDELFRAENVLELLRQLERGPYRLIARQAREIFEQRREPFALETTIDQRYYAGLARQVALFRDANHGPLQRLLGALLDRVNLLWLLRFRFSYQLSPSETFYQLVPSSHLLHRETLLRLVNLETFERVLEALPPPLQVSLAGSTNLIEVQRRINRHVYGEAEQVLRHGRSGIARALAYLMRREMDLFLLFSLIQGHLLELPHELIETALELVDPQCPVAARTAA